MNTHQFLLLDAKDAFICFAIRYYKHYHAYSPTEPLRARGKWGLFTVQWSVK